MAYKPQNKWRKIYEAEKTKKYTEYPSEQSMLGTFYSYRTPCRYCDHCYSCGYAVAGPERRQRKSTEHLLRQQHETARSGTEHVSEFLRRLVRSDEPESRHWFRLRKCGYLGVYFLIRVLQIRKTIS